jgi:hypothetical protein
MTNYKLKRITGYFIYVVVFALFVFLENYYGAI